jgi:hypothetical protein
MKSAAARSTFRSFWHGAPVGPYQLVCLASFVQRGYQVELFSYDRSLEVPHWIALRDAREIYPTDHVLKYQIEFGRGSPALHANLFRYAMLHRLGGWWIDLDVVMLREVAPQTELFFARLTETDRRVNQAVLKFPAGHPLLAEARDECIDLGESVAVWGETGPTLITRLIEQHGLAAAVRSWQQVHPIPWNDLLALFDPARCQEVQERCGQSDFLHLFNEAWRGAGIPPDWGPPEGSFLDRLFVDCELVPPFTARLRFGDVSRWITNRLDARRHAAQSRGLQERCAQLSVRCHELEAQLNALMASRSWRATAPLRSLVNVLRRPHRPG